MAGSPYIKRSIRIHREMEAALKVKAAERGNASLNSIIRQAIDQWLKDNP